jgi:hypothetical protein
MMLDKDKLLYLLRYFCPKLKSASNIGIIETGIVGQVKYVFFIGLDMNNLLKEAAAAVYMHTCVAQSHLCVIRLGCVC